MKMNSEKLFKIYFKDLLPNSRYEIKIHFIGALRYNMYNLKIGKK